MKYPFPFIGAGRAEYFEWFNMTIIFDVAPDALQIDQIIKTAPEIIRPSKNEFSLDSINVGSEQFINLYIESHYGEKPLKKKKKSMYEASKKACDAFEADITRWLKEVHVICPIAVVLRPEDGEAGGTDLSEWHEESGEMIVPLIRQWLKTDLYVDSAKAKRTVLQAAALHYLEEDCFEEENLMGPMLEYVMDEYLFQTLKNDDLNSKLLKTPGAMRGLIHYIKDNGFSTPQRLNSYILFAIDQDSDELLAALHAKMENEPSDTYQWLNYYWHRDMLSVDGFNQKSAKAYWFLMDVLTDFQAETSDLTLYNNISAHCIPEGEIKTILDKDRMKKAVDLCEKFAPKNPLIHFNLFVIQSYLHNSVEALKNAEAYFASQDPNAPQLKIALKKNDEYDSLRNNSQLGEYIDSL